MESEWIPRDDAAAQLAALQADRTALAERAEAAPWWYDALLSLLLFAFLSSYALHNTWVSLAAVVVFLLCLRGMMVLYRRLTGFWVNGFRKGLTRRAVAVWMVTALAVIVVGFVVDEQLGWTPAMPVAGAVLSVVLYLVNRWWARLYVAELRGEG
jgi:hypothetical protein